MGIMAKILTSYNEEQRTARITLERREATRSDDHQSGISRFIQNRENNLSCKDRA